MPYLAVAGRLRRGLGLLADARGLLLFVALALSWPVPVLLADPNALRVWSLEISQKVGGADFLHHRHHQILAADWFWMTAPWVVVATMAVLLPLRPRGRAYGPAIWFPWWWAVGNLAMFCAWSVAKPNYYLPCLPGVAVLVGIEWVRLSRAAREPLTPWALARPILQFHWVALFVGGAGRAGGGAGRSCPTCWAGRRSSPRSWPSPSWPAPGPGAAAPTPGP